MCTCRAGGRDVPQAGLRQDTQKGGSGGRLLRIAHCLARTAAAVGLDEDSPTSACPAGSLAGSLVGARSPRKREWRGLGRALGSIPHKQTANAGHPLAATDLSITWCVALCKCCAVIRTIFSRCCSGHAPLPSHLWLGNNKNSSKGIAGRSMHRRPLPALRCRR